MTVPPALLSHESTAHYPSQYLPDAVIVCLGAIDLVVLVDVSLEYGGG